MPEEIQDQEIFLLDRQSEHAEMLENLGIVAKARAKLSDHDAEELTDLSRPSISLSRMTAIIAMPPRDHAKLPPVTS